MAFPSYTQIMKALLEVLRDMRGEANCNDVIDELANRFGLTTAEREIKDNGQFKFSHMCHTARVRLVRKGALASDSPRGIWSLAKVGLQQPTLPTTVPKPPEGLRRHDDLKQKMVEIGNKLGHYTSKEEGPEYRHDVLWKATPYRTPSHVVEVCEGGVLAKDFASLIWARENWGAKGILVVTDDKDFKKATRQFSGHHKLLW